MDGKKKGIGEIVAEYFPGQVKECGPIHYSELSPEEQHKMAEAVRGRYRCLRASSIRWQHEKYALISKRYEGMSDLEVLEADRKMWAKESRRSGENLRRFMKVLVQAEEHARKHPSKIRYATAAA
jgi:hypothetical protein